MCEPTAIEIGLSEKSKQAQLQLTHKQDNPADQNSTSPGSEFDPSNMFNDTSMSQSAQKLRAQREWDFMSTNAYWSSIFFTQGSMLFAVSAIFMYPGLMDGVPGYVTRAWVNWTAVFGAFSFLISNYLCYFQAINQRATYTFKPSRTSITVEGATKDHRRKLRLCVWPENAGHTAALLNCVASIFSLTAQCSVWADTHTELQLDLWYVVTGTVAGANSLKGAICQGEYNDWRHLKGGKRLKELPVLMSYFSLCAAVCFLTAYLLEFNNFADRLCHEGMCIIYFWGECTPFLVGALFLLANGWMQLWMWKNQAFGIGFARDMIGHARSQVNKLHFVMVDVYMCSITICFCRLAFLIVYPKPYAWRVSYGFEIGQRLMTYYCILFLASAIHKTPDRHPYDYLMFMMYFISAYGFVTECCMLYEITVCADHGTCPMTTN